MEKIDNGYTEEIPKEWLMLLNKIKTANTVKDLIALGIGAVISYSSSDEGGVLFDEVELPTVAELPLWNYKPRRFGAICEYQGPFAGYINTSEYNIYFIYRKGEGEVLDALAEACGRAYENLEISQKTGRTCP